MIAGIAVAILLPAHTTSMCPSFGSDMCVIRTQLYLPLRFGVAIGSAFPLAIVLAGLHARRWMAVAAAIVVPSGIALALVLPSSLCPEQLVTMFCSPSDHSFARFGIIVGAFVAGAILIALSALRGSRSLAGLSVVLAGVAAALFLPSTNGIYYPDPGSVVLGTPQHRILWRIIFLISGVLLGALIWAHERRVISGRARDLALHDSFLA
jgi:hypothetical protein